MYVERNYLMKNVYPKLQNYCKNMYDLDFMVSGNFVVRFVCIAAMMLQLFL